MGNRFLTQINEKSVGFSKGQRRIGRYITENYDQAAFMTANQLGKSAGVSESTVVRFAVELGYTGYPEMQKAMQVELLHNLSQSQTKGSSAGGIRGRDMVSMVLRADAEMLRKTGELLDREAFNLAVNAILNAKNIYLVAAYPVSILAQWMHYHLSLMFDNVYIITEQMAAKLVSLETEDVLIIFDFPQYSKFMNRLVQLCRNMGVKVIGFTDSELSAIARISDITLVAKSGMISIANSLTAPLSLMNAFIAALATHREKVLAKKMKGLDKIRGAYDV